MDPVVGAEPVPLAEGLYEALEERRSLRNLIPFHVSWSPDGNTIAFTTRWAEINNQISVWTIRSDGRELRHVFEQDFSYPDGDALPPSFFGISWSPSGEQLVIPAASYSQKFNKFSVRDKIGLIAIDGIELGAIGTSVFPDHAGGIDWAGGRIYFTDKEVNLLSVFSNFEIRFTSDEGSGIDSLGIGFNPKVSPDGTTLAYQRGGRLDGRWSGDTDLSIYLMDLGGRNEIFLAYGMSPSWSPDSQKIAFIEKEWRDPNIKVNIINADGTGLETIYEYEGNTEGSGATTQFVDIAWSPWLDDIVSGVSPASWGTLKREVSE